MSVVTAVTKQESPTGAGEIAQKIGARALVALSEDPSSIPSTPMAAHIGNCRFKGF